MFGIQFEANGFINYISEIKTTKNDKRYVSIIFSTGKSSINGMIFKDELIQELIVGGNKGKWFKVSGFVNGSDLKQRPLFIFTKIEPYELKTKEVK